MSELTALLTHASPRPWSISCVRTRIDGMSVFRVMDANPRCIGYITVGLPEEQYQAFADAELLVRAVNILSGIKEENNG